MNKNRRADERVPINLPARWDGLAGKNEARIEDLSASGCFVNTQGRVDVGELVGLQIKLPSGQWLALRGEVASYLPGTGFGVLFTFLTEEEQEILRDLMN